MKKIVVPALIFFSTCCLFTSCDNGKYDITPSVDKSAQANPLKPDYTHAGGCFITAEINGSYWANTKGYMDYIKGEPYIYGSVQPGDISSVQQISLSFVNYHGVGNYDLNADGSATWLIDSLTTNSTFGQILVDSDAKGIIKGRFNFVGEDLVIKKGNFRVIKTY